MLTKGVVASHRRPMPGFARQTTRDPHAAYHIRILLRIRDLHLHFDAATGSIPVLIGVGPQTPASAQLSRRLPVIPGEAPDPAAVPIESDGQD